MIKTRTLTFMKGTLDGYDGWIVSNIPNGIIKFLIKNIKLIGLKYVVTFISGSTQKEDRVLSCQS